MPRRSISDSAATLRRLAACAAANFCASGFSFSSRYTSCSLAVTFMMPARRVSVRSAEMAVTVALMSPILRSCTVSPTRTGRAETFFSLGCGCAAAAAASSATFSLRRRAARASLARWWSASVFSILRSSSSSRITSSAVRRASPMMRSASRRAFSSAFSSRTESSAFRRSDLRRFSSASRS